MSRSPTRARFRGGLAGTGLPPDSTEGRTPVTGNAALRGGTYLRIRFRSTYCMMPPLR